MERLASVAAALLAMGREGKVLPVLKHRPDPSLRSFLIKQIASAGPDPEKLWKLFQRQTDVSIRRALLLALGGYGPDRLSKSRRSRFLPALIRLYRDDPDPGIHSASEWLIRKWGGGDRLLPIDAQLAEGGRKDCRWYVNGQGHTMVVIQGPVSFWMGMPSDCFHRQTIKRTFAISTKEVTRAQFLRFRPNHKSTEDPNCPANFVSWYLAAAYCNWLSEQEGMPKDQWCYLPNAKGEYAEGMRIAEDWRDRTGYRLPTEAEWEYACRAGAETTWSFGSYPEVGGSYVWFGGNAYYIGDSYGSCKPVARLKPNDLGLFDMHGNVWEWCQDRVTRHPSYFRSIKDFFSQRLYSSVTTALALGYKRLQHRNDVLLVHEGIHRMIRGGSYVYPLRETRAAIKYQKFRPSYADGNCGFRVARTIAASPSVRSSNSKP